MSFLKLYQDFLQKKEGENRFQTSGNDAAITEQDTSGLNESGSATVANSNITTTTPTLSTTTTTPNTINNNINSKIKKMEHSYMRGETRSAGNNNTAGLTPARTIVVRRPPQCSSCHHHPLEEDEMEDDNKVPVPAYNEIAAKDIMNECTRIAQFVKNYNADDEIWEERIVQYNWTPLQKRLFDSVTKILDKDYLGRLANAGRQHEAMYRRILIDASSTRFRKALADVCWDVRLTQWVHGLLMENLPPTYMASYLDILQTLKSKVPLLMDKMLFGRPMNCSQELMAPVLKPRWTPTVCQKVRKLSQNVVIVIIPGNFGLGKPSQRLQKWQQQLSSFAEIVTISLPTGSAHILGQPLEVTAEQMVSLTRVKIQELRNENHARSIILVGLNAGAAMAVQVAMSVNISAVVCLGFAYNTMNGVRGAPDDRLLDIKIPILFVIGQNSARTSQEEIESLRERMQSESALIVVGSADDVLRVPKSRRNIECVTQSMVDTMIVDEVYEYIKRTLANPPGPRTPIPITGVYARVGKNAPLHNLTNDGSLHSGHDAKIPNMQRKRKVQELGLNSNDATMPPKSKYIGKKGKDVTKTVKKLKNERVVLNDWENYENQLTKPSKRKVGRPRLRPLPVVNTSTATTTAATTPTGNLTFNTMTSKQMANLPQKAIVTNMNLSDDNIMNEAMQSILDDDVDLMNSSNSFMESTSASGKPMTSFELVAQPSKTSPLKPQPTAVPISTPSAKIKIIPSNQFVQLKPGGGTGHLQTPTQIYTIKNTTPTGIGNIVNTSLNNQPQIITLKTTPTMMGQSRYTLVKNSNRIQLSNAHPMTTTTPTTAGAIPTQKSNVDITSIINLPIVFADQQGNLTEAVNVPTGKIYSDGTTTSTSTTPAITSKPIKFNIINQRIFKPVINTNTNVHANNITADATPITKASTVKIGGQTYILNKPIIDPKKLILINPSSGNAFGRVGTTTTTTTSVPANMGQPIKYATTLRPGTQIVPISAASAVSGLKQVDLQDLQLNRTSNPSPSVQKIKILNSTPLNSNSLSNLRNIVLKPGQIQPFPTHMKTQFINRTVNMNNFIPATKMNSFVKISTTPTASSSTTTSTGGIVESRDVNFAGSSPRQSAPKIITIDPLKSTSTSFMFDGEEYTTMSIDDLN